jgi:hypothetical protein
LGIALVFYGTGNFVLSLFSLLKVKKKKKRILRCVCFCCFCCFFFFFGYFVRREKRSAIIPLISFSLFFPENIRGILLLVIQQALPILRRDCNDLRAGRKETWEGDLPGFLPTKKEREPSLSHTFSIVRQDPFCCPCYLFVCFPFFSFPLFFLLLFPQEL